jgi:hypothetical protein
MRAAHPITNQAALFALAVLAGLGVTACQASTEPEPSGGVVAEASLQPYPGGPTATPVPVPVLAPDASGYYPAPPDIPIRVEALDTSPNARILTALQAELDDRSASALADRVWDHRGGLHLGRPETVEGGGWLDRADTRVYLEALLRAGSPRLQGYRAGDGGCMEVVSGPWQGRVVFPTPTAPHTYGEAAPTEFATDAASWRLCDGGGGEWQWVAWRWLEPEAGADTYAQLVTRLTAGTAGPYVVLRPAGSDVTGP